MSWIQDQDQAMATVRSTNKTPPRKMFVKSPLKKMTEKIFNAIFSPHINFILLKFLCSKSLFFFSLVPIIVHCEHIFFLFSNNLMKTFILWKKVINKHK